MVLQQLMLNPSFSVFHLTAAINRTPFKPGLIGSLGLFSPRPLTTTVVMIESAYDTLALVPSQPRGAPATANVIGGRGLIPFLVPHFPIVDSVMADAILGVRAFGTDNELEGIQQVVAARIDSMGQKEDVTQEWLRLGAVRGVIITSVDKTTGAPLSSIDLFAAFGVTQQPPVNWPIQGTWDETDAWSAPIRGLSTAMARTMAHELGGSGFSGIVAICGSQFFDAVISAPEIRQTYLATPQAQALQQPTWGQQFTYAGIRYAEYFGGVGNMDFVASDTAYFFPVGVPDLFVEAYAPADYMETVNTLALPRYAKQNVMDFDKGVEIEVQMNVLPLCTRPRALITAHLTPKTLLTSRATAAGPTPGHAPAPAHAPAAHAPATTRRAAVPA